MATIKLAWQLLSAVSVTQLQEIMPTSVKITQLYSLHVCLSCH